MYGRGRETATTLACHDPVRRLARPDPVHPQGIHEVRLRADGIWVRAQVKAGYVGNHGVRRRVRAPGRIDPPAARLVPLVLRDGQLPPSLRAAFFGFGKAVPGDGERNVHIVGIDSGGPDTGVRLSKAALGRGDAFSPAVSGGLRAEARTGVPRVGTAGGQPSLRLAHRSPGSCAAKLIDTI